MKLDYPSNGTDEEGGFFFFENERSESTLLMEKIDCMALSSWVALG